MKELFTISAKEMARRIRAGELSPVEAVEAHIRRIQSVNGLLNAVVVDCFEAARQEAKAAEARLSQSRDNLPPLFGVPCTIKDCFAVAGYPWAAGVWARKDLIAEADATVVERVRKAGAIVLGKTNVPEGAMWIESYNYVYGRTNNPYDLKRTVGGSSGGEGSIVGAGASPFGIGSDIGGSIRYPSAFNGVAGHKPTGGLVSGNGHWPTVSGPLTCYNTYGPIARRVEDLALLLPLLAGPDGKDPAVVDKPVLPPESVDLSRVKVYYFDNNGQVAPDQEIRRAVALAAGGLAGQGLAVEYWMPRGVEYSLNIWLAGLSQNQGPPFREHLGGGKPISLGKETLRFITRTGKITAPGLAAALIEAVTPLAQPMNKRFIQLAHDLQRRIEDKLGDNGVLLSPVFASVAPLHGRIAFKAFSAGYSGLINILEFPSTIIPVYHRPDGMPASIQIVGGRFRDHLTLAVAGRLEKIFGGWKPPARLDWE